LRYYFKYIAGLPERTVSAALVFGSAIHRGVEHHFNELLAGNEPPTLEALTGEYDRHWRDTDERIVKFGKDDDRESLHPLAQRMFAAFQASTFAQPEGHIIGVEEQLRGPVIAGCPDLLGRIDLLIETNESIVVTDLKTARSRWSSEQVADQAGQLLLYSELVRGMAPHKKLRLRFAVVTKAKLPSVDLYEVDANPKQIDRTKRIVERVWRAIEARSFYPAPTPMQCPTCPFRAPCRDWQG
jgi:RecB family exonuclease